MYHIYYYFLLYTQTKFTCGLDLLNDYCFWYYLIDPHEKTVVARLHIHYMIALQWSFGVLSNDVSTCGWEEVRARRVTLWLIDDYVVTLSHSHPVKMKPRRDSTPQSSDLKSDALFIRSHCRTEDIILALLSDFFVSLLQFMNGLCSQMRWNKWGTDCSCTASGVDLRRKKKRDRWIRIGEQINEYTPLWHIKEVYI